MGAFAMREFIDFKEINAPSDTITEAQGYMIRDGKHLFYSLYKPVSGSGRGVVIVSPFAEEKVRTLRILVTLSRALAKLGMTVMYFDYYGDGDSEGDFEEASFGDRIADIKAAANFMKETEDLQKVGMLGLRWGATLAGLLSDEIKPAFLIMWEPIVNTEKYFFDHLRSNVASQMLLDGKVSKNRQALVEELEAGAVVTVEGYNISGRFFVEARNNGLSRRQFEYDGKTLIVQISRNKAKVRPELAGLHDAYKNSEIAAVDKEFEWEKTETWNPAPPELFNVTFEFLAKNGFIDTGAAD
jgi:alpha/beta superfamily hydrolase